MKKILIGFIAGICTTSIVFTTISSSAEGIANTIEVIFNSINLTVNGQEIQVDNILYNGTTYAPIRAVAEMLDKEVGWDGGTQTVSINGKPSAIQVTSSSPKPTSSPVSTPAPSLSDAPENVPKEVYITEAYIKGHSDIDPYFEKFMGPSDFIMIASNWTNIKGNFGLAGITEYFQSHADRTLRLIADGHPTVEVKMSKSSGRGSMPNSKGWIVTWIVSVDSEAYRKMPSGVKYKIVPVNNSEHKWIIAEDVYLVKP